MHRDTKLGLALAILVMGFAAALCFPRVTPASLSDELTLPRAAELDASIRMLPVRGYTAAEGPQPKVPVPPESGVAGLPTAANESLPLVAPEPIPLTGTAEPTLADSQPVVPATVEVSEESTPARIYVVQHGDSLNRIARLQMGSEALSEELFQANRDVIPSRERLLPGMELVIPEVPTSRSVRRGVSPSVAGEEPLPADDFSSLSGPMSDRPAAAPPVKRQLFSTSRRVTGEAIVRPQ